MIAAACIAAHLPPTAFGVDERDVPLVGVEILHLLKEQADRQHAEAMKAKLRSR